MIESPSGSKNYFNQQEKSLSNTSHSGSDNKYDSNGELVHGNGRISANSMQSRGIPGSILSNHTASRVLVPAIGDALMETVKCTCAFMGHVTGGRSGEKSRECRSLETISRNSVCCRDVGGTPDPQITRRDSRRLTRVQNYATEQLRRVLTPRADEVILETVKMCCCCCRKKMGAMVEYRDDQRAKKMKKMDEEKERKSIISVESQEEKKDSRGKNFEQGRESIDCLSTLIKRESKDSNRSCSSEARASEMVRCKVSRSSEEVNILPKIQEEKENTENSKQETSKENIKQNMSAHLQEPPTHQPPITPQGIAPVNNFIEIFFAENDSRMRMRPMVDQMCQTEEQKNAEQQSEIKNELVKETTEEPNGSDSESKVQGGYSVCIPGTSIQIGASSRVKYSVETRTSSRQPGSRLKSAKSRILSMTQIPEDKTLGRGGSRDINLSMRDPSIESTDIGMRTSTFDRKSTMHENDEHLPTLAEKYMSTPGPKKTSNAGRTSMLRGPIENSTDRLGSTTPGPRLLKDEPLYNSEVNERNPIDIGKPVISQSLQKNWPEEYQSIGNARTLPERLPENASNGKTSSVGIRSSMQPESFDHTAVAGNIPMRSSTWSKRGVSLEKVSHSGRPSTESNNCKDATVYERYRSSNEEKKSISREQGVEMDDCRKTSPARKQTTQNGPTEGFIGSREASPVRNKPKNGEIVTDTADDNRRTITGQQSMLHESVEDSIKEEITSIRCVKSAQNDQVKNIVESRIDSLALSRESRKDGEITSPRYPANAEVETLSKKAGNLKPTDIEPKHSHTHLKSNAEHLKPSEDRGHSVVERRVVEVEEMPSPDGKTSKVITRKETRTEVKDADFIDSSCGNEVDTTTTDREKQRLGVDRATKDPNAAMQQLQSRESGYKRSVKISEVEMSPRGLRATTIEEDEQVEIKVKQKDKDCRVSGRKVYDMPKFKATEYSGLGVLRRCPGEKDVADSKTADNDPAMVGNTWDIETGKMLPSGVSESSLIFPVHDDIGNVIGMRELDLVSPFKDNQNDVFHCPETTYTKIGFEREDFQEYLVESMPPPPPPSLMEGEPEEMQNRSSAKQHLSSSMKIKHDAELYLMYSIKDKTCDPQDESYPRTSAEQERCYGNQSFPEPPPPADVPKREVVDCPQGLSATERRPRRRLRRSSRHKVKCEEEKRRKEAKVLWAIARINDFGDGERTLEIVSTDDRKPMHDICSSRVGSYEKEVIVIVPPKDAEGTG